MAQRKTVKLTTPPLTSDYLPTAHHTGWYTQSRTPPFTRYSIVQMLQDPRILFGLWLIKGPILTKSRFYVRTTNPQVKDWLKTNITRFWRNSAMRVLKALEWGYSCSEVLWRTDPHRGNQVMFNTVKDLHSLDCKAITLTGALAGAEVMNVPSQRSVRLPLMRMLWHVHQREAHPWYGRSRLYGAYKSWTELWSDGGYRDTRRLYFHKYAFDGGTIYHPPGQTNLFSPGQQNVPLSKSNKDIAREIVEKAKTGGTKTFPSLFDEAGHRLWEHVPPAVTAPPSNLLEYGSDLRDEEWEGMGIPPEIVHASNEGGGIQLGGEGKRVTQEAFFSTLQEMVNWLIFDADEQVFRPGVIYNFGLGSDDYEIMPFGLLEAGEQDADGPSGPQGPGLGAEGLPGAQGIEMAVPPAPPQFSGERREYQTARQYLRDHPWEIVA